MKLYCAARELCNATDFAVNAGNCLTCTQCKGLYHPFCSGDGRDKYKKCGKCAVSLLKPGIPQKTFLSRIANGTFYDTTLRLKMCRQLILFYSIFVKKKLLD